MQDLFNHVAVHVAAPYRPHNGAWVKLVLKDKARHAECAKAAEWTAGDGALVCLFSEQHRSSPVTIKRADGTVEETPSQLIPPRLVLVGKNGHNVPYLAGVKDGHADVRDYFIYLDSPAVESVEPLLNLADLPPGRHVDVEWAERFHGRPLPNVCRLAPRLTVGDIVAACQQADAVAIEA